MRPPKIRPNREVNLIFSGLKAQRPRTEVPRKSGKEPIRNGTAMRNGCRPVQP